MTIIPRNDWCDTPPNRLARAMSTPAPRVWLHHGASGSSTLATARAYARYHIDTRRWADVGYSWIIADGQVLEGRGPGRQGAHTAGDNHRSHGICIAGDYTVTRPSTEDLDALVWLLRHGVERHWWTTPAVTGGHRDAPRADTTCPGDALHRLIPQINAAALKEDDMALTVEQERALAMIPKLAADVAALKGRVPSNLASEIDRLRIGQRAIHDYAGIDLGNEGP